MVVYVDVLIIINFIINYFLLKITQIFSLTQYNKKRLILSALIGAIFSLGIFLNINSLFFTLLIKLISLCLCVILAFGYINKYYFFKNILAFLLANFLLIGFLIFLQDNAVIYLKNYMIYFNINPLLLIFSIIFVFTIINIFNIFFRENLKVDDLKATIFINNTSFKVKAFYDTGFKIKDIINNKSVMLIDYNFAKEFLGTQVNNDITAFFLHGESRGNTKITPIFYSTINGEGLLPAIKIDKMILSDEKRQGQVKNVLLAFSKEDLSNEVQLILGKEILRILGD